MTYKEMEDLRDEMLEDIDIICFWSFAKIADYYGISRSQAALILKKYNLIKKLDEYRSKKIIDIINKNPFVTYSIISMKLDIPYHQVKEILNKKHYSHKKIVQLRQDTIMKYRNLGYSVQDIMFKFGISKTPIYAAMRKSKELK